MSGNNWMINILMFIAVMIFLFAITGCTPLTVNSHHGGFPPRPELVYIKNGGDLNYNLAKMNEYIELTEKAKGENENVK